VDRTERERLARHRASVQRQGFVGFGIIVAGCAWGTLVARRVGERALDHDVAPIAGPLILIGIGSVILTIAVYRKIFMRPKAFFGKKVGEKILEEISDLLD
jgi:hypothetical protein